jgi:ATP-dependent DNA helicase RecG
MLRSLPVTHIPGVGQAKQKCLADLGIHTVYDVLHYFPRKYEDRRPRPLEEFASSDKVTVRALVEGTANVRWHGRKSVCTAPLRIDQRFRVTGIWFNQHYLKPKLTDGRVIVVSGRYDPVKRTLVASHTDFGGKTSAAVGYIPVYPGTKEFPSAQIQAVVEKALDKYVDEVEELLPLELVQKYRLLSHRDALLRIHRPKSEEDLRQAHRRLAFEEFFLFQLQLQWHRAMRVNAERGVARRVPEDAFTTFAASLPYPLTKAQQEACRAIAADLAKDAPMHRLIQGDVGSGKTWVAFWAAYAVYRSGDQAALMAPTEILAEQHFAEAKRRLEPLGMSVRLLTGSTPTRERAEVLDGLQEGTVDLVIGTHALLTEDVSFASLGLVITDEQHRFGVSQRSILRQKARTPDILYLSATPIPRTLALAIYGDLDVTALRELPAGRQPVKTLWLKLAEEEAAIRLARRELAAGRQVYVVAPLVEESEHAADILSATELEVRLRDRFAGFQVRLLHGRMSSKEKEAVMREFAAGAVQVLVSTTVIEVGIHVANATVMMIYHAERFGLAQLHQLRGRVGRGKHASYCVLLSDARSDYAVQRLQTMVETQDGFVIAEKDLELRGPGEFLGVRQSGLPEFSVGDLAKDFRIMEVARDEAAALIQNPDFWLLPAYHALKEAVRRVPENSYYKD